LEEKNGHSQFLENRTSASHREPTKESTMSHSPRIENGVKKV